MDLIRTLLRHVKPGDTLLDIGANVGGYTQRFREHCPETTIHCFEPIPVVFAELKETYGTAKNIHCWNLGVGAEKTVVKDVAVHEAWTINRPGETARGRNATYGGPIFDMRVTTVDSFLLGWPQAGGNVSAIKIDTDGYDYRVLVGAVDTIVRCRPRILIEFGYCITDLGDSVADMLTLIAKWDYDIYDDKGRSRLFQEYHEWYPYRTTADYMLIPAEQELDPR